MRERAGIDDQTEDFRVSKFTDCINDETFVIGLIKLYANLEFIRFFSEQVFQVGERLTAIDGRFAFAEPV